MERLKSFASYLDMLPLYGLIVSAEGSVLHKNKACADCKKGADLLEIFGDYETEIKSMIAESLNSQSLKVRELSFCGEDRQIPVYLRMCPVEIGQPAVMIKFHSIETRARLEAMMFDRRSHLPTDARWTIDEDYRVLDFSVDEDSFYFGREPGFYIFEAVPESGHEILDRAFLKAKGKPGEIIEFELDVQRKDSVTQLAAEIMYAPDMYYGNRYYCLSRPAINTAPHILNRMLEAYQLATDKELARILETDPSAISRVRNGTRKMQDHWIVKCCRETLVNLQWLDAGLGSKFWRS